MNGVAFPFRDLIVFTAFSVVLGTLVLQGLTLGPLLRALVMDDDHEVEQEVNTARERGDAGRVRGTGRRRVGCGADRSS